ncbi:MAG: helix-turn-helix domain-containing protein [Candidatus Limnocylindrales bacterium]
MDPIRFGLGIRALRRRRGWSQLALAVRAGLSRSAIARIERGQADRFTIRTLRRVSEALDARIDVRLLWHAEGLDRLLDARHAALVDQTLGLLAHLGWTAIAEVSFSIRGERGSVDVLAFHPATASLLVVEVKSVVPDLQAMLVALDRKGRLGGEIARERGWAPASVTRLLVLPDDRTARRRVEALSMTFRAALPARTVDVRRWLRAPVGTAHGILFLSNGTHADSRQAAGRSGSPS